jgi:hypothetical protein
MAAKEILTVYNACKAATVSCISNPEWGTKRFNYNEQPLTEGRFASTVGIGCNSKVLFESEYHLWQIENGII